MVIDCKDLLFSSRTESEAISADMNRADRDKYIETFDYPFCDDVGKYEKLSKIGQGTFGYALMK